MVERRGFLNYYFINKDLIRMAVLHISCVSLEFREGKIILYLKRADFLIFSTFIYIKTKVLLFITFQLVFRTKIFLFLQYNVYLSDIFRLESEFILAF